MIRECVFWNDKGSPVGTAFCDDDRFIMITELDKKQTSIIKKDGKIFDEAVKYLQRHEYTFISSDAIYDIEHEISKIESMLSRKMAHRKGWLYAEEVEREDQELTKRFFEE